MVLISSVCFFFFHMYTSNVPVVVCRLFLISRQVSESLSNTLYRYQQFNRSFLRLFVYSSLHSFPYLLA